MNVEDLIKNCLQELQKIGWENKIKTQNSKLIFPKYRNKKQRRSEQEARLLFIRELEKPEKPNFYYSIETPTNDIYKDFRGKAPKIGTGKSGNVDVTLYTKGIDKFEREHLVEFKFDNVDTCRKDFLKLLCDDNQCEKNYYINILKNTDDETIPSLIEKYKDSIQYVYDTYSDKMVSNLLIIVGVLEKQEIYTFEEINKKNRNIKYKKERLL